MTVKLKNRLSDIESHFMKKYGNKENFENLDNYKFIRLLCEKVPNAEISQGLPNSLLGDVWEVAYDIVGNLNISNTNLLEELIDFFEYISTTSSKLFYYATYFLDELKTLDIDHTILAKVKPNTKKLWTKHIESCK